MPNKQIFGASGPSDPDLQRSTFDKSFTNNLTAGLAKVYPCLVEMCMPDSTYSIKPHMAFDMFPILSPIQTNITCHLSYYKIPLRILWRSYMDFFSRVSGVNGSGQFSSHVVPYISRDFNWHTSGSLADYMGIPSQLFVEVPQMSKLRFSFVGYFDTQESLGTYVGANLLAPVLDGDYSFEEYWRIYHGFNFSPFYSNPPSINNSTGSGRYKYFYLSSRLEHGLSSPNVDMSFALRQGATFPSIGSYSVNIVTLCVYGCLRERVSGTSAAVISKVASYTLSGSTTVVTTPGTWFWNGSSYDNTINGQVYSFRNLRFVLPADAMDFISSLIEEKLDVYIGFGFDTHHRGFGPDNSFFESRNEVTNFYQLDKSGDGSDVSYSLSSTKFPARTGLLPVADVLYSVFVNKNDSFNSPFMSVEGAAPKIPINAFAFRAYEFIHNYFFRNQQVDPFFKSDGSGPYYNQFLTNDGDGADETTPLDFFNALYEYDLFTTLMPTPQFGPAPLVGITSNDGSSTATLSMVDPTSSEHYNIAVQLSPNGSITGIGNYDEVADKTSVVRLLEAINFGISINDFRNVSAFQVMNERFLKAGYKYPDLVQEFFGVRPPVGEEYPEYLGGLTRQISIDPVTNVAQSAGNPLGEKAATGFISGHGEAVKCHCKEWCIIMGLVWFTPTPVYSQKLDKHFLYHHYLDFYNPQLAAIGPQPVYKKQLCPLQLEAGHEDDVLGYGRPWAELCSREDETHGQFRDSMYHYILQRSFAQAPSLGHDFITIDEKDLNDVWAELAATGSDKFFGAIRHEMLVTQPVPRVSIPHIVG